MLYHTIIGCLWTPTLYDCVVAMLFCIAESEIKVTHTCICNGFRYTAYNKSYVCLLNGNVLKKVEPGTLHIGKTRPNRVLLQRFPILGSALCVCNVTFSVIVVLLLLSVAPSRSVLMGVYQYQPFAVPICFNVRVFERIHFCGQGNGLNKGFLIHIYLYNMYPPHFWHSYNISVSTRSPSYLMPVSKSSLMFATRALVLISCILILLISVLSSRCRSQVLFRLSL